MEQRIALFLCCSFVAVFHFTASAFTDRDSLRNEPGRDSSLSVRKITDVRKRFEPRSKYNYLDYIQNQNSVAQDGNFWIGGNGIINGNLLIGTTTDAGYKLDVNGTGRFTGDLNLGISSYPVKLKMNGFSVFEASDINYLTINQALWGGVRIKHSAAASSMASVGGGIQIYNADATSNNVAILRFYSANGVKGSAIGSANDELIFATTTNSVEKARLTSDGNFLIGTSTNAGYKIDVNGTGRVNGDITSSNGSYFPAMSAKFISRYAASATPYANDYLAGLWADYSYDPYLTLAYGKTINGTTTWNPIITAGGPGTTINSYANLRFTYSGISELMRLTYLGSLLIGTTTDAGYKLAVNGSTNALSYSLNTQGLTNKVVFNADQNKVYISKTTYASLGHLHVKDMDSYANVLDPSLALATFDINGENIAQMGSNQVYNATSVNVNASSMPLTGTAVLGTYQMKGIEVRARQQAQTALQNPYTATSKAFGIKITSINDDAGYWANGSYGLYIDATASKANTAYAIYSNTGLNYFADKLLIGNTSSQGDYKLQLSGSLLLNGQVSEPAGVNGGVIYNSATNQFKGYRNGQWKNFLMEGDASENSVMVPSTEIVFGTGSGYNSSSSFTAFNYNGTFPAVQVKGTSGAELILYSNSSNGHKYRIFSTGNGGYSAGEGAFGIYDETAGVYRYSISTSGTHKVHGDMNVSGNIGINTLPYSNYQLAVNGDAIFTKVKVKQYPWADYVFNDDYKLPTLKEVEEYIKKHKHLPDVPSAKEVEQNGLDVGENQATLLKKIEELTLYIIAQDKKIEVLETQNKQLSDIKKELELIKAKLQNQ